MLPPKTDLSLTIAMRIVCLSPWFSVDLINSRTDCDVISNIWLWPWRLGHRWWVVAEIILDLQIYGERGREAKYNTPIKAILFNIRNLFHKSDQQRFSIKWF
jgi:hypothetical protein